MTGSNWVEAIIAGVIGGMIVWFLKLSHDKLAERSDAKKIREWLKSEGETHSHRTREIASYVNLTEDRVRYVCSRDEKIYRVIGIQHERWSVHSRIVPEWTGERDESGHPVR